MVQMQLALFNDTRIKQAKFFGAKLLRSFDIIQNLGL